LAASIIARQSRGASLVTALHPEYARLKHLELIATRGSQVLMVIVLDGGEVRQQILNLVEVVSQDNLSKVASWISLKGRSKDTQAIADLEHQTKDVLKHDLLKLVVAEMLRADEILAGDIYRDGLANVLIEPEFAEPGVAHRALRFWEERTQLEGLLSQTVLASDSTGVHVLIGGDGTWEDLSECAVVLSRYGVPGVATGVLGVLGPTRMPYANTISTIQFVGNLLGNLVGETLSDERFTTRL
jgi:heat-inducible transcriptional repressor